MSSDAEALNLRNNPVNLDVSFRGTFGGSFCLFIYFYFLPF